MPGPVKKKAVEHVKAGLESSGLEAVVFPAARVPSLYRELKRRAETGEIGIGLVQRYISPLSIAPREIPPWAKSVVLVAMGRPIARFRFEMPHRVLWAVVPPQYRRDQEISVGESLAALLHMPGSRTARAEIPLKLAAARCGLGRYGKNNLVYTRGNGSFLRLVAFFLDLECEEGHWGDPVLMDACAGCAACLRNCPTGCLAGSRFIARGELCIAFHNEDAAPIPGWIEPHWHNSLLGCMRCQSVCPANRAYLSRILTWDTFSKEETETLLTSSGAEDIPGEIAQRFDRVGIGHYLPVIGRNLRALADRANLSRDCFA